MLPRSHSTVGIAIAAAGSDAALETADIALMGDDLAELPVVIGLSHRASRIIRQNLYLSLGMVAFLIPGTIAGVVGIGPRRSSTRVPPSWWWPTPCASSPTEPEPTPPEGAFFMSDRETTLVCPKCQGSMRAYERNGVTIDQCRECRGVFLDRGELDRLIDAEEKRYAAAPPQYRDDDRSYGRDRHEDSRGSKHGGKRRRGSFLGELFD